MKSFRLHPSLVACSVAALLAGCGQGSSPTAPDSSYDTTPPATPSQVGMSTDPTTGIASLDWDPSTAADIAGYQVFLYSPSPARDNAYVQVAEVTAATPSFRMPVVSSETRLWYRVRAVDTSGNRSGLSTPYEAVLIPGASSDSGTPGDGRVREN